MLTANLINHPNLQLGPALRLRFGRKDVEDDVVDRMADIDPTLEAGVRYSRLLSDAKDSPVVDERGSASQLAGGVGVLYSW